MENKQYAICQWCGKTLIYSRCSPMCTVPEDALCIVLQGWLSVCHCTGVEAFDHYDFCSFTCIKKWSESRAPEVPETFLKAFMEE